MVGEVQLPRLADEPPLGTEDGGPNDVLGVVLVDGVTVGGLKGDASTGSSLLLSSMPIVVRSS